MRQTAALGICTGLGLIAWFVTLANGCWHCLPGQTQCWWEAAAGGQAVNAPREQSKQQGAHCCRL